MDTPTWNYLPAAHVSNICNLYGCRFRTKSGGHAHKLPMDAQPEPRNNTSPQLWLPSLWAWTYIVWADTEKEQ